MAQEDVDTALSGFTADLLWLEPGGVASVGFHLVHLAGSTGRLLTYARGEALSESQRAALARERTISAIRPPLPELLEQWHEAVAAALQQLAATPEASLSAPRLVGRAQLPSTVLGLLFHAAEHASRHAGQLVTTAKLVRSSSAPQAGSAPR
jgi:hypothetical protein